MQSLPVSKLHPKMSKRRSSPVQRTSPWRRYWVLGILKSEEVWGLGSHWWSRQKLTQQIAGYRPTVMVTWELISRSQRRSGKVTWKMWRERKRARSAGSGPIVKFFQIWFQVLIYVFDFSFAVNFYNFSRSSCGWNELGLYAVILAGSTGPWPIVDKKALA